MSKSVLKVLDDRNEAEAANIRAPVVDFSNDRKQGMRIDLTSAGDEVHWVNGSNYTGREYSAGAVNAVGVQHDDIIPDAAGRASIVVGTDGDDELCGSMEDDYIDGRAGDDWLHGYDGDDILVGGAGADRLDGGDGEDFADYSGSGAGGHSRPRRWPGLWRRRRGRPAVRHRASHGLGPCRRLARRRQEQLALWRQGRRPARRASGQRLDRGRGGQRHADRRRGERLPVWRDGRRHSRSAARGPTISTAATARISPTIRARPGSHGRPRGRLGRAWRRPGRPLFDIEHSPAPSTPTRCAATARTTCSMAAAATTARGPGGRRPAGGRRGRGPARRRRWPGHGELYGLGRRRERRPSRPGRLRAATPRATGCSASSISPARSMPTPCAATASDRLWHSRLAAGGDDWIEGRDRRRHAWRARRAPTSSMAGRATIR